MTIRTLALHILLTCGYAYRGVPSNSLFLKKAPSVGAFFWPLSADIEESNHG